MPLLPEDARYLVERNINHVVQEEAGMTCLVLQSWALPPGLNQQQADILIRLAPGYPDVAPDMWWVDPPLQTAQGGGIPNTESVEFHVGRNWQRWSRHFNGGQWQPGIDRLESFIVRINGELRRHATGNAA